MYSPSSRRGFSLGELALVLVIVTVTIGLGAAFFAPLFFSSHSHKHHNGCMSNQKQIGLAFLQYIQDYDERFPPVAGGFLDNDGKPHSANWGLDNINTTGGPPVAHGLLSYYSKSDSIFHCPDVTNTAPLTYMYNDLVATVSQESFTGVAQTILVAEGEEQWQNAGHAWEPQNPVKAATFNQKGTCDPGQGATVRDAPRRHSEGAFYLFADGHVKWHKPEAIFFPDRRTNNRQHKLGGYTVGPEPGGKMVFGDKEYGGTFHVR
jgi:prepilin-type processing-associated H-X9-DG protein